MSQSAPPTAGDLHQIEHLADRALTMALVRLVLQQQEAPAQAAEALSELARSYLAQLPLSGIAEDKQAPLRKATAQRVHGLIGAALGASAE